MTENIFSKTNLLLAGSLLTLGASVSTTASASGNPFEMTDLASGYQVAHEDQKRDMDSHDKDTHKSGEKHSGDHNSKDDHDSKDDHNSKDDHDSKGDHDSKDDHDSKSSEGKCGAKHMDKNEGKCGGMK